MASNGFIYRVQEAEPLQLATISLEEALPFKPQVGASFLAEICELFRSQNPDFILN
jgi:hypothetical protein